MSVEIRFMVTLVVSDKITDDAQITEMSQNIANAIVHGANTSGITPEDSDSFTEIVYVKEWYSDKQIIEHVD